MPALRVSRQPEETMTAVKLVRSNSKPKPAALPWIDQDTVRRLRLDQEQSKRVADGDPKARGLKLRKQGAALSFVFEAKVGGRAVAITLGNSETMSAEDAREQARKLRKAVDQGKDPRLSVAAEKAVVAAQEAAQLEAEEMTLRRAIVLKMASSKRPRSALNYSALLSADATVNLLHLADRPLASITKNEWRAVLKRAEDAYGKLSPKAWTIKRAVAAVYRHAVSVGTHLKLDNPIASVAVERNARRREGRLKEHEIAGWYARLTHAHSTAANLARLYLFTGMRDREARELLWSEIEPECIRIPADRVKTKHELLIPRTAAIDIVLQEQERYRECSPYVFPATMKNGKGERWGRPISSILPMLKQLGCSVHDLRRTVATFLDQRGVPENIRRHLLNHSPDISRGYVQRDVPEMRKHLWAYHNWLADLRSEAANAGDVPPEEAPTPEQLADDAALDAYDREQAGKAWL